MNGTAIMAVRESRLGCEDELVEVDTGHPSHVVIVMADGEKLTFNRVELHAAIMAPPAYPKLAVVSDDARRAYDKGEYTVVDPEDAA